MKMQLWGNDVSKRYMRVFNALRVHQNKHLMYHVLFIRRSPVRVVSGCLEVAPAVKARAWGKNLPFF